MFQTCESNLNKLSSKAFYSSIFTNPVWNSGDTWNQGMWFVSFSTFERVNVLVFALDALIWSAYYVKLLVIKCNTSTVYSWQDDLPKNNVLIF